MEERNRLTYSTNVIQLYIHSMMREAYEPNQMESVEVNI
jgi:hypothetical protein